MITLYSYPSLFGVPDNNPYGLKVYTFLKLTAVKFKQENTVDTSQAPRGQLPYVKINNDIYTDSNAIIADVIKLKHLTIDSDLSQEQSDLDFLVRRMLDEHLYWVISYSRWADSDYWPMFKHEFKRSFPAISEETLEKGREYNLNRYYYQGIGRHNKKSIYEAGTKDIEAVQRYLRDKPYFFGDTPHTVDACIYGFLANIYFFEIETPLKQQVIASRNIEDYCNRVKSLISRK